MPLLRPEFPDHSSPFSRAQERRRKEAAILSAAARRFDREGVARARLEDVAADLGLTKTSISYYFASKEELAEAVYRASARFLTDAVREAAGAKGDASARIEHLLRCYADQLCEAADGRRPYLAAISDLDVLNDTARASVGAEVSDAVAQVNALVRTWIADSGAPIGRPEPVTFLILGLLDWLGERRAERPSAPDIQEDLRALLDMITHGLLPGAGRRPPPPLAAAPEQIEIFDRDARNRMKREAFMKAGTRMFNQKGFGGVALSEVAASLGVTRGAFYYHIPDKQQFLDQCLERSLEIIEAALDQAEASELDPASFLRGVMLDLVYRQAAGVTPLLRPKLAAVLPPARRRRHLARLRNISRRIGDALSDAEAAGEARAVDVVVAEDLLSNMMFLDAGYTLAAANSVTSWGLSEEPRAAAADYVHLLFFGLRGSP